MAKSKSGGASATGQSGYYSDATFVDWELSKDERAHFDGWRVNFSDSLAEGLETLFGPDTDRVTIKWDDKDKCWCVWVQQRILLHETRRFILAARGKTVLSALAHAVYKHDLCSGDYKSHARISSEKFTP